jgi:hypothetical protein
VVVTATMGFTFIYNADGANLKILELARHRYGLGKFQSIPSIIDNAKYII